jgi:hypothetical protein
MYINQFFNATIELKALKANFSRRDLQEKLNVQAIFAKP